MRGGGSKENLNPPPPLKLVKPVLADQQGVVNSRSYTNKV